MTKYLVISYDPDEQQWFHDVLFAKDEDAAEERIAALRDYCNGFNVFTMKELSSMTAKVLAETRAGADAWMAELEAEAAEVRR